MITKDLVTLVVKSQGVDKVTIDFDKLAKGVKELELEAKDAKAGIRGLKDENKALSAELKKTEKHIKEAEKALAACAKKSDTTSDSYRHASESLKQLTADSLSYRKQIDANKATVTQLEYVEKSLLRTMNVQDMTMKQLTARASELRGQLDRTSKSLNPEKWNKLNNKLIEVEKQQDKVTAGGNKVKSMFDKLGVTVSKTLSLMVAYQALRFFQDLIGKAVDWIKAAPEVAAKTEGISKAFGKLNNRNLLSTLRTETKGLINDMLLMQSAVKADRFGIPINNLAKYLKFAQQRAQETGGSVDYLSESIINGIGRKSPLILDNLGISAARLKAEMAGGASIVQATTKIVEEELKKQGDLALTTADRAQQASVKWDNAQVKLGQRMTWLSNLWSDISGKFADSVTNMIGDTRTANQVFDDQIQKVADLEVNIVPLVKRYEELKSKASLNSTEQLELNRIMNSISSSIPGVIAEFDKYGNILSINTSKVYDYIEAEKARLQFVHKETIDTLKKQREDIQKEYDKQVVASQKGEYVFTSGGQFGGGTSNLDNSPEALEKAATKVKELGKTLMGIDAELARITGSSMDDQLANQKKRIEKRQEFTKMNETLLKAWIDDERNAKDDYIDIAKEVYQARVGGDYGDTTETKVSKQKKELETQLNNLESAHKTELQTLRETKTKEKQTDEQFKIDTAKSDKKYYASRIKLLEDYKKKVSDKNFISDIDKKITDTKSQKIEIDPVIDSATLADLAKNRDILLRGIEIARNENIRALESLELSEEQHAVRVQSIDLSSAQTRLEKLKDYHKEVQNATITDAKLKEDTVRESGAAVVAEELDVINKRKAMEKSFFESNRAAREKFGVITSKEQMDYEKVLLQQQMLAGRMSYETYQQGLTAINEKYEKQRIQVREQYGIASQQELYDMELQELVKARDIELWTEEEFEKAKWQLKLKYATQFTQKINTLSSTASSLVSALMEAETAKLDAEYDVRIEAAKNNSKETERLENEKAQKKLDIEKKYADVQFAVKASDIIANTAVAIMTGYAQLGPVMGTIAAAMLGVTGAAQLAAANAEREKVKGMTLGGSSESSKSYSRVITGKEEGGRIDVTRAQDGKQFSAKYDPQKRGFVDRPTVIVGEGPAGISREWVASNALLRNPTAGSIISLFDEVQRSGQINTIDLNPLIRARMAGLDSGGFMDNRIPQPASSSNNVLPDGSPDNESLAPLLSQLYEILEYYKYNRIRADVNIRELNEKQERLTQSQNLGKAL